MKWTGFGVLACVSALTIACAGNGRNDRDRDRESDRSTTAELRNDTTAPGSATSSDTTVGTSGQASSTTRVQTSDSRQFVQHASMASTAEIELGKLASQRAQSADVKQFAQMMIRDHTRANNELKAAVKGQNVELQTTLDSKHQQLMDRLKTLKGAEFDREYMKAMVDGHMDVREMLDERAHSDQAVATHGGANPAGTSGSGVASSRATSGSASALDTKVDQWASKTLPTVEQHLQKAQQIQSKLDNTGTSGSAPRPNTAGQGTPNQGGKKY